MKPVGIAGSGDAHGPGKHERGTGTSCQQATEKPKSDENEDRYTQPSRDHRCASCSGMGNSTGSIGSPLTNAFSRARSAGPRRMMWV